LDECKQIFIVLLHTPDFCVVLSKLKLVDNLTDIILVRQHNGS